MILTGNQLSNSINDNNNNNEIKRNDEDINLELIEQKKIVR